MRFRPDLRVLALCALALCATAPSPAAETPTQEEIDHAVETVKADPNLATERKVRTLKWDDASPERRRDMPGWLRWIGQLFAWFGEVARWLLWAVLAILAALLLVFIARLVRSHRAVTKGARFVAPSHVQDLDIRPASLPDDIGAAARALWDRGDQRAALALLYRGLLSRLAHVHEVQIRDSSTEGDCLALAARALDETRAGYVTQLVRTWQRAIYGGLTIEAAVVHALCAGFAANLDRRANTLPGADNLAGQPA